LTASLFQNGQHGTASGGRTFGSMALDIQAGYNEPIAEDGQQWAVRGMSYDVANVSYTQRCL